MSIDEIKSQLQTELPALLQQDIGFRRWLEDLIRRTAVTSERFDDRFDRVLRELAADREAQAHKWEEQNRKWDEQNRLNHELLDEIRKTRLRQEQGLGAVGARWGLASEASFRSALKGILEKSFGVEVININEFDDEGTVFGVPDQVEIDIIVRNGDLILCELKSSMSKSDIYTFERKVQYYQRRHGREVSRKLVISPMVRPEARPVAERLGIEIFGYAEDVPSL